MRHAVATCSNMSSMQWIWVSTNSSSRRDVFKDSTIIVILPHLVNIVRDFIVIKPFSP